MQRGGVLFFGFFPFVLIVTSNEVMGDTMRACDWSGMPSSVQSLAT